MALADYVCAPSIRGADAGADLAVEEIERRADDNRFVSVLVLAQGETLLAAARTRPVYQAAENRSCRSPSMPQPVSGAPS